MKHHCIEVPMKQSSIFTFDLSYKTDLLTYLFSSKDLLKDSLSFLSKQWRLLL